MNHPFYSFISLISFVSFIGATPVFAAPLPQLALTWRAGSYVESSYAGKVLPGLNTPIAATVQLIDDGKVIDLSKRDIRWFVNNKLASSGVGQVRFSFQTDEIGLSGASVGFKAVVLGYKGVDIQRAVTIPIAAPEVVVRAPLLTVVFGAHTLRALLYFWGVTNPQTLRLSWGANGARVDNGYGERAVELQIPLVFQPTPIRVTVDAKNPANEYEFANEATTLTAQ